MEREQKKQLNVTFPRCAYCRDEVTPQAQAEEEATACPGCLAYSHAGCLEENQGNCPSCSRNLLDAPQRQRPRPDKGTPGTNELARVAALIAAVIAFSLLATVGAAAYLIVFPYADAADQLETTVTARMDEGVELEENTQPLLGGLEAERPDLSHVQVGQRYHYQLSNAGMELGQVWEITEIGDVELKYTVATYLNGKLVGEPTPISWSYPVPSQIERNRRQPPAVETVRAGGREWECWVVESGGALHYCPKGADSDAGTFPPIVRSVKDDGEVTLELTKVEPPR